MPSRKEKGHYGWAYRQLRSKILLEEDTCYLCGGWVDKTLHWTLDGAPQIHLKIPLTRGGSWRDRSNAVLTHRLCNIRQNNRLEGELAVSHRQPETQWVIAADP